jgi:hypothetical protein
MLHSKTFTIALITAGLLAAPMAHASYPSKHSCKDIKLEALDVKLTADKLKVDSELKGLKKKEELKIWLRAKVEAEVKCKNPGGYFPKPHQSGDIALKLSDWQKVDADMYGSAEFYFKTPVPAATCKQPFTPIVKQLTLESVTLIVEQGKCKVKFECEYLGIPAYGWMDIKDECKQTVVSP